MITSIFESLNKEYFERKKPKRHKVKKPKNSIISDKYLNRELQGLKSQQRLLERLLAVENPAPNTVKKIKRLQRRITRKLEKGFIDTSQKPKKYKNKIVRNLKQSKCPTDYQKYIESKFWTARKNRYYQNYLKMCARCGTKKYVSLHHKYYEPKEFGDELDDHLCPLCNTCHYLFHEKYGVKKDMIKDTNNFLTEF